MLTPFGRELRKLRVDRDLRLLDLAERLGQSVAFVSAIETGRRNIPSGYVEHVVQKLDLNVEQSRALRTSADQTRTEVEVAGLKEKDRELVAAFARNVSTLSDAEIANLRKKMLKSAETDRPFQRRRGLIVSPTSRATLTQAAERVRSAFIPQHRIDFPVMQVVEFGLLEIIPDFYLDICDRDVMGSDEGRVIAGSSSIMLRSDVYEAACKGNGRARFTVCHELGHFLMHRQVVMARRPNAASPIYCDAEWQADEFAERLLLSPRHAKSLKDASKAASECVMSWDAARVMLDKYQREGIM